MSRYFRAKVSENRQLNSNHNLLTLTPLDTIKEPESGQFYMIGMGEGNYDPLLKRPFSIFRKTSSGLQILYRVKGRGTTMMRNLKEGFVVDVLGPLGNAYPLPDKNDTPLIIAGGMGMASVFSLTVKLAGEAYLFYGARSVDELFFLDELKKFTKELFVSTDDGSYGVRGNIVDVLNKYLTANAELITPNLLLYACGPRPLFEALWRIVMDKEIKAYVSLEESMACGIGACLGCVVKTVNGYQRVCNEGPIFPIDKIAW